MTTWIDSRFTWQPAPGGQVTVTAHYGVDALPAEQVLVKANAAGVRCHAMYSLRMVGRTVTADDQSIEVLISDEDTVKLIKAGIYKALRLTMDGAQLLVSLHDSIAARDGLGGTATPMKVAHVDSDRASRLAGAARRGDNEAFAMLCSAVGPDRATEMIKP